MVIVAAHNEADRIGATLKALAEAFLHFTLVADDASTDGTSEVAPAHGARVVRRGRSHGKGGNVTAAEAALSDDAPADLACWSATAIWDSARRLTGLVDAVADTAAISRWRPSGCGSAADSAWRSASRWGDRAPFGYRATAPISGQRAMRREVLEAVLPFAPGYGMEIGMMIDAVRAGYRVCEMEPFDLEHGARPASRSAGSTAPPPAPRLHARVLAQRTG